MKRTFVILILAIAASSLVIGQAIDKQASQKKPQNNQSMTGSYLSKRTGSLDVLLLPDGKVKFLLNAPMAGHNFGVACAIVPVKDNTAIYKNGSCEISLKFEAKRVIISQKGDEHDCDFGTGVTSDGVYIKRHSRTPQFDQNLCGA